MKDSAYIQVFHGAGCPMEWQSWPLPAQLSGREVLVAIHMATICGSDLHTLSGHRREATPLVLGHEAVGIVQSAGPACTSVNVGDRVTWSIADSCSHCPPCQEWHLPQKCQHLMKYGHAALQDESGLNGCYATHILIREGTHLVKVPSHIPDEVAAPANCALATVMNIMDHIPSNCKSVLVQGAGLLGLYSCAVLHQLNVKKIFCMDNDPGRLSRVAEFKGIPITPDQMDIAESSVDAVIEVAGTADIIPYGIRCLRPGGHYLLAGMVHPNSALNLTGEQIIRKCLNIVGIHNYSPKHLDQAVNFLAETLNIFPYSSLVSPPQPLQCLESAVILAQSKQFHRVALSPARTG